MRALIVVDLQNDFLPGGTLEVQGGDQVIPVINALMPSFELVVATRDWHPPDHGSFAENHEGKQPGDEMELNGLKQILWPTHCIQETPGAEFPETLDTARFLRVFDKGTDPGVDSYSGFFDNARRHDTGLNEFLKARGANEVYVAGLATDVCVRATALDAVDLGYTTHMVKDACRAVNLQPGDGEAAIHEMKHAGVRVVTSKEVSG
jgi:nicotinamidase/pyrazinamidase